MGGYITPGTVVKDRTKSVISEIPEPRVFYNSSGLLLVTASYRFPSLIDYDINYVFPHVLRISLLLTGLFVNLREL